MQQAYVSFILYTSNAETEMAFFVISRQAKTQHVNGEGSRIPASLQAVFLASNRGADVSRPPPQKSAFRMFSSRKTWFGKSEKNDPADLVKPGLKKKASKKSIPVNRTSVHVHTNTKKGASSKGVDTKNDSIPTNITVLVPIKKKAPLSTLTPQQYLESLLRSRGYSVQYYDVMLTAYYNKPSPFQEASYGVHIVDVVRRNDSQTLDRLLSLGLSPNACNCYGESLVHLACRRGNFQSLQTMIDFNCNIQVSDDYGRTPFHDLCWASEPSFQSAAILLEIDSRMLFMKDCRGSSPLAYARQEHWADWIKFLESRKDEYWPKQGHEFKQGPPQLAELHANSQPIADPENAIGIKLAALVSSGKMTIDEAELMKTTVNDDESSSMESNENTLITEDIYEENEESSSSFFDEEELNDILATMKKIVVTA
jgi:Ankyrin repeats (many copies)